jgi:hypothetical protein
VWRAGRQAGRQAGRARLAAAHAFFLLTGAKGQVMHAAQPAFACCANMVRLAPMMNSFGSLRSRPSRHWWLSCAALSGQHAWLLLVACARCCSNAPAVSRDNRTLQHSHRFKRTIKCENLAMGEPRSLGLGMSSQNTIITVCAPGMMS